MLKPGYAKFWEESKFDAYHPEFITYIDSTLNEKRIDYASRAVGSDGLPVASLAGRHPMPYIYQRAWT